jgi:peptide chain release factor 1
MRARLEEMAAYGRALEAELARPEVASRPEESRRLAKQLSGLAGVLERWHRFQTLEHDLEALRDLIRETADQELRELAEAELTATKDALVELEQLLQRDLLPKDPNDEKNVLLEIRAGTGGEEAALFAADLLRMYMRYAERQGWRTEILSANPTDIGGYREVVLMVEGQGAFSRLKFERGVHRVQRVPTTEASGRIHTSAATVAVLPEVEEVELDLNPDDLRIETMRAGGAGGQHVNKTESAVRITHLPTGITVHSQDERSQHKNRDKALRILRARVQQLYEEQQANEVAEARRSQVGSGDRSERIRTYNFPQNRVTDHRVGLTLHRLDMILQGDLDELIQALVAWDERERLKTGVPLGDPLA